MKTATVKEIRYELNERSPKELVELCLRLSRFKKENKELLTYLLFEAADEESFVRSVKAEVDQQFEEINRRNYYFIKKSIRKILRNVKKYIRYSQIKETEADLLLYFCYKLKTMSPSMNRSKVLKGMYDRQIVAIKKAVSKLHEDLQADYEMEINSLL